jgi:hypothetical protein
MDTYQDSKEMHMWLTWALQIWNIEASGDERKVTYLSTLKKHTQAVNVVRWCPRGTPPHVHEIHIYQHPHH